MSGENGSTDASCQLPTSPQAPQRAQILCHDDRGLEKHGHNKDYGGAKHQRHMEKVRSRTAEIAREALKAYSEKALVRATISAIPWVAGPLDAFLSTKGQKIVQGRITSLLAILQEELRDVHENQVDTSYIESEDFFDLMVKALEAAARTREREKISLYAQILKGAVVGQRERDFSGEEAVRIVLDLTPRQMEVARTVYHQQKEGLREAETDLQWAVRAGWENLARSLNGLSAEEAMADLIMLQRAGLLREITGSFWDYSGGILVMTPVFRRLMTYLIGTPVLGRPP